MSGVVLVQGGRYFLWDAEQIKRLRFEHRIVVDNVGCLPSHPTQNQFLGIPAVMMPEQVALGLKHGWFRVSEAPVPTLPSPEDVAAFQETRRRELHEQSAKIAADRQRRAELFRQKRAREEPNAQAPDAAKAQAVAPNAAADAAPAAAESVSPAPAPAPAAASDAPGPAVAAVAAELPLAPASSVAGAALAPAPAPAPAAPAPAEPASAAAEAGKDHFGWVTVPHARLDPATLTRAAFDYPRTDMEFVRARVFEDLWERGYYLSPAAKFGGDYLAYAGDPLKYHAVFVVVVHLWQGAITARDLVSIGRLAVTVKKSPVIATLDERAQPVYFTVDWQGVT